MPTEPEQKPLFEKGEWWENHWKGMPEFVQKDQMPFKTIFVHFESRSDMESFAKLVGQTIGLNTKSVWYPEADIQHWDKEYVDSSEVDDSVEILGES